MYLPNAILNAKEESKYFQIVYSVVSSHVVTLNLKKKRYELLDCYVASA